MPSPPQLSNHWRDALAWRAPLRYRDPHLLGALCAAVPVWLALGAWVAPAMRAPASAWAVLWGVLLLPLLEELVFRGLLQGQLLRVTHGQPPRRCGPISGANGLTTLVFVAVHLFTQPLGWALAVAAPSLLLGHLRERLDSVWPAAAVHVFYNAGFVATAWWASA